MFTQSAAFFASSVAVMTFGVLVALFVFGAVFRAGYLLVEALFYSLLPWLMMRWRYRRRQRWA